MDSDFKEDIFLVVFGLYQICLGFAIMIGGWWGQFAAFVLLVLTGIYIIYNAGRGGKRGLYK